MKALIKPRELGHRSREFDFWVRQLARLRRARPLVAAVEELRERGAVERSDSVLTLEIEDVQHAARLVHEGHQLDNARVENPEDLLAEILSSGTMFTGDSRLLSRRPGHRGCTRRFNDRMSLIEREQRIRGH